MASEGRILVTPEALETQAGIVRTEVKNLQDAFNQMRNRIAETKNYWTGEAADEHRENYEKNKASIEEILERYKEHVRDLETMAGVYREAETAAKNMADELPAIEL